MRNCDRIGLLVLKSSLRLEVQVLFLLALRRVFGSIIFKIFIQSVIIVADAQTRETNLHEICAFHQSIWAFDESVFRQLSHDSDYTRFIRKKTELKNSLFFQHNSQTLWYHLCLITLLYQRLFDTYIWCRVIEWYIITINSKQIEYIFIKNAITFHKLMHLSYHHCSVLERVYGWLVDNLMITLELSWSGSKKWKYKEDKCT